MPYSGDWLQCCRAVVGVGVLPGWLLPLLLPVHHQQHWGCG